MRAIDFPQQLLDASDQRRRQLLNERPETVGESEVNTLAERARAEADAHPVEALRIADVAWELAEALEAPRARALAYRARAVALRAQARWSEARECFREGARLAEEAGDPRLAAQIPIAETETLAQLGRYEEALHLADGLERRLRALGAEEDAAKVIANAGNIHFQREAYAQALDCWERALHYFTQQNQPIPVARLQMNIANVLTHLNRLPEALDKYQAARSMLEAAGMDLLVAGLDGNIGFLRFHAGQYAEALQAFTRARQRFETLSLPKDVAQCDRETADLYLELNLLPEAQDIYARVEPLFLTLKMPVEAARCQLGLAVALAAQQRDLEALTVLEKAEKAFHKEHNEIGVARARLQRVEIWLRKQASLESNPTVSSHETAPIRRAAKAALRTFRRYGIKMGEVKARLYLAELRLAEGWGPTRLLSALARDAEAAALLSLQWRIESALARAWMTIQRPRAALKYYRRAVNSVERLRLLMKGDDFRIAFLQDKMRLFEELLALLLDQGTRAARREAFQLAERAKSRTLVERLTTSVASLDTADPEQQRLLHRLEALRAQLNWDYGRVQEMEGRASRLPTADAELPHRLQQLEQQYLETQRQLQITGVQMAEADAFALPTIQNIQMLLEEDEQIVEYAMVRDEVLAFVVDRNRFHTVRGVASRKELEQLADRLNFQWSKFSSPVPLERFQNQLLASTQAILRRLYNLLLEPLEDLLSAPRLTVIPHGVLHGIPFHALYDGDRYALDCWECAYAPSSAVWRACRLRDEPKATTSLVFGVPDPGIAHVRQEVDGLQRLLPEARIYCNEAAATSALPLEGAFRYLHFATHAVFRNDNPLFSGLRLADGWLTAHDLYRRRLDCSLATLSACRTGVSLVASGDEVLGLARGFLHAGARGVVLSLWAAHDKATAELMCAYYASMVGGMGRAAALRAAQKTVRACYTHPYYWAAFALIGAR